MNRRLAVLMVVGLLTGAVSCESSRPQPPAAAETPDREASPKRAGPDPRVHKREPTKPQRLEVTIAAIEDRRRVTQAVADLKELGFWKRLTKPVAAVLIATRSGIEDIPEDGHLADAQRNVQLGPNPGWVCDVMIYSASLEADVQRQSVYYSQGRLDAPPPTLRQFWTVILAHELAHCSDRGQKGEGYSTRWESRVLQAYDTARVGSP